MAIDYEGDDLHGGDDLGGTHEVWETESESMDDDSDCEDEDMEGYEEEKEHQDVPVVYPRRRFEGARNVETVKEGLLSSDSTGGTY